ncbi:MAG: hypothetical protein V1725_03725 [archaeon]
MGFALFRKDKEFDAPASLPELARDILEKKETEEKAAALIDTSIKKEYVQTPYKEPTAQPQAFVQEKTILQAPAPIAAPPVPPVQQAPPAPLLQAPVQHYPYPYPAYPPPMYQQPTFIPYPVHLPQFNAYPYQQLVPQQVQQQAPFAMQPHVADCVQEEHVKHMHDVLAKRYSKDEHPLQESVDRTMAELKELEAAWRKTKDSLEKMEQFCVEKERDIERKSQELKLFLDHLRSHRTLSKACPSGREFRCVNGLVFQSMKELKDALDSMPDATFFHHVTPDRNDFANWVREVFMESVFAERIRKCPTRSELKDLLMTVV